MSITTKEITIADLKLWDENARFPDKYFNTEETELINYFLSKPDFKIKPLIEAIINDFDLPQLEKLVVWNDNGQNVVLEGNRRLTAYKLLNNPELTGDVSLRKYLTEQKNKTNITDRFLLECLVAENKDDGLRYIDRKHANGNNEVNWQDSERAHYNVRRGSTNQGELLKIGITKIVKELELPDEIKEQILGSGYVTTFFRVITTTPAKKEYGYEIDENGNLTVKDPDFKEKLKIIIYNVLSKKDFKGNDVDSRSLNKTEKIEEYIKSVKVEDVSKVDEEIKKNTAEDLFGEKNIKVNSGGKQKEIPKSTNRTHLIPASCNLIIPEVKINNIYRELKDDLLLDDSKRAVPNAVAVLFRVFLETTIDCLLEKEGINLPDKITLAGKITKCCDHLENQKIATKKQLGNIRKVATDKHHLLGIQNFHDYVHSYKSHPSSSDLKSKWENLQEFFEIVWTHRNKKVSRKKIK
jgi:hypothetical protein